MGRMCIINRTKPGIPRVECLMALNSARAALWRLEEMRLVLLLPLRIIFGLRQFRSARGCFAEESM